MEDVISWIKILETGHYFYCITVVALIPLFILMKKRRLSFLLPMVLMTILILTPFFYKITNDTVGYYWRILWILPVIPLCATLPCVISEKIKEKFVGGKIAIVVLFAIAFIFLGTFVYGYHFGIFDKPTNAASKLPKEAVEVADYLLSIDENPRAVIVPEIIHDDFIDCWIITGLQDYIRQYTGEIDLLYGRVNHIFDMSQAGRTVYNNILDDEGDLAIVAQTMLDYGYSYLVVKEDGRNLCNNIEKYGFKQLGNVSGYLIYRVSGYPSELRDYNELGQVTTVTYIDQNGNPREVNDGYSIIKYEYDWNGNIVKEFRTDRKGMGITNSNGYAGWEREYDYKGRYTVERQLGENEIPVISKEGYYELRKYYGFRKVTNSYFDSFGNPYILAEGYSSACFFYNKMNQCIKEKYYNPEGNLCITTEGYAEVCREYDDRNLCICEKYFGENEEPLKQEAGYYGKRMEYDDDKRMVMVKYLDSNWEERDRTDGYSRACWVDNKDTGSRDVVFYNKKGEEISVEGLNLVNGVHYGIDGWTKWMSPMKNTVNDYFNIGTVNLGHKNVGDAYTCCVTIEFSEVNGTEGESFVFLTHGSADGKWGIGNVWDSSLICLDSKPEDGIYCFKSTVTVNEAMESVSGYNIGFRCDNWETGCFRVREVIILKGEEVNEWVPGL